MWYKIFFKESIKIEKKKKFSEWSLGNSCVLYVLVNYSLVNNINHFLKILKQNLSSCIFHNFCEAYILYNLS